MTPLYPLITNYNYDINNILLSVKTKFEKKLENNPTTELNKVKWDSSVDKKSFIKYTTYELNYDYDRLGKKPLSLLTHYIKLEKPYIIMNNAKFNNFNFELNTCHITIDNVNFNNFITDTFDKMISDLVKLHPNLIPEYIKLPYSTKNNEKILCVKCMTTKQKYYGVESDIDIKILTPIHFHKSKGNGIITINNESIHNISTRIMNEMPIFKHKLYGKEICDSNNEKQLKNIYYEGKFVLLFSANVKEITTENNDELKKSSIYCYINVFAKEIEIKHNVSYVKSVFSKDIVYIDSKNNNISSLTL